MNRTYKNYIAFGIGVIMTIIAFIEPAFALFNIESAVAGATDPVVKGILDHWGKGVLIAVFVGVFFGRGDRDILRKQIKSKQQGEQE